MIKYLYSSNRDVINDSNSDFQNREEMLQNIELDVRSMYIPGWVFLGVSIVMGMLSVLLLIILHRILGNIVNIVNGSVPLTELFRNVIGLLLSLLFIPFFGGAPFIMYLHNKKVKQPDYPLKIYEEMRISKRHTLGKVTNISRDKMGVEIGYTYNAPRRKNGAFTTRHPLDIRIGDTVMVIYTNEFSVLA